MNVSSVQIRPVQSTAFKVSMNLLVCFSTPISQCNNSRNPDAIYWLYQYVKY